MQAEQPLARKTGRPTLEAASALHERLLGCALTMLCERGIGGLAMDALAQKAAVTKRTIYRHFENKLALVEAVVEREILRVETAMLPADGAPPSPLFALEEWARHYFVFTLDPAVQRFGVFLSFERLNDADLANRLQAWTRRATERPDALIVEAQAAGEVVAGEPHLLTLLLMDLLQGPNTRMTFNSPVASVMGGLSETTFFASRWAAFLQLAGADDAPGCDRGAGTVVVAG